MKFFSWLRVEIDHSVTQLHHVRAAAQSNATHYCSAREHNHNKTTPFPPGRAAGAAALFVPGSMGERSGRAAMLLAGSSQGSLLVY